MGIKERIDRAEYDVDVEAVAEAIIRRLSLERRAAPLRSDGVLEALEIGSAAQVHA